MGSRWLACLALHLGILLRKAPKFLGFALKHNWGGSQVTLFQPDTFMNESGIAVCAFCHFYRILPEEVLVVYDEMDFAPGVVRLKYAGSDGGHKGVGSVIAHLASQNFYRLRLGVGRPKNRTQVSSYVLSKPPFSEEQAICQAIDRSILLLPQLISGQVAVYRQQLHSLPTRPAQE